MVTELTLRSSPTTDIVYTWYLDGTQITGATADNVTVTLPDVNDYVITANVRQIVTSPTVNCSTNPNITVHAVDVPAVASVELNADTICAGYQVAIAAANVTGGTTNDDYIYTWYRNGVEYQTGSDSIIYDTPEALNGDTATYIYSVVVSQASSGCISEAAADTLYVFPNPTVWISGDQIICDHGTINLHANLNDTVATHTFHYDWRLSNTHIGTDDVDFTVDTTFRDEPYIFTVTVYNERGCSVTSDPYYVYVNDSVRVEVTHSVDSICPGGEVTFTANLVDYNADNLVYRWSEVRGNNVGDTVEIHGATSRILTIHPTQYNKYIVDVMQTTSECKAQGFDTITIMEPEFLVMLLVLLLIPCRLLTWLLRMSRTSTPLKFPTPTVAPA